MEITDIRCNPRLYFADDAQARKDALYKLGLAFENILMIIGRNHREPIVRNIFTTSQKLTTGFMLSRLFESDRKLKAMLLSYGEFDRSKNGEDFENKIRELLNADQLFIGIPHYMRYYTLSTLVRNYYSHEGCQDTMVNRDESLFQQVINEGLLSILSIFKYFTDRGLVEKFEDKKKEQ
jgi:hypothetical protein